MASKPTYEQLAAQVDQLQAQLKQCSRAQQQKELKIFQILYDLAVAMVADHTLDQNLQMVVDQSRAMFDADTAFLGIHEAKTGLVCMKALSGVQSKAFKCMQLPPGKGMGGRIMASAEGLIVEDYLSDKQFDHIVDTAIAEEGLVSGMAVPMHVGSEILGVLYVFNRKKAKFSQKDLNTLDMVGHLAAIEISRHRMAVALNQAHNKLEERVQRRTQALTKANQQLLHEIEDRIQAENSLRQSEERFQEMAAHIRDVFWLFDLQQKCIVYVSPAYEKVWGRSLQRLYDDNRSWMNTLHPEDRPLVRQFFKALIQKKTDTICEYRICLPNGEIRWIRDHGSGVADKNGKVVRITGIANDITSLKNAEAEKEQLAEKLRQVHKMEAIGTLAGGISHDFNNILMNIQGRTSLMRASSSNADHPFKNHLKAIEASVHSASRLTRQLLDFSRGGSYEVAPISINELLKETLRLFGRARKEIDLDVHLDEELWSVVADRSQLEQVLLNLYVNAQQAIPKNGRLTLESKNVTLEKGFTDAYQIIPGRYIKISVTDNGCGIDPAIQSRIFEPFFTTKERQQGTGLGLASAYGIVKKHGGLITVTSQPNVSTTFHVYLPASDRSITETVEEKQMLIGGSETVLLVDDEDIILSVTGRMLNQLGYRVLVAADGRSALDLFQRRRKEIALVLLDMVMPGMGGEETFANMKTLQPDVRVLLCSGYSIEEESEKRLARKCDGFIQKPFTIEDIDHKIRQILDEASLS